jgi:DNA-binding PadR family transcriptional regulator
MDKFQGFPQEKQTWQFPNVINGWVHILTGAEFKCLWYILRHTYGWQKTEDAISISQFMRGIKKKNGEWLDKGTGLSNRKVIDALKKLEEYGFISSCKKERKTTIYRVVKKVHKGSEESSQVACEESSQTINTITIDNKQYIAKQSFARKDQDIFEIIELFNFNPSYKKFFKNITQRKAVERLISQHGEKLKEMIKALPQTNKMQYAPIITTPIAIRR